MRRISALLLLVAAVALSACDQLDGGPRKVIVNEAICGDVQFLRLNLGETNRIVLDNSSHSDNQGGILFRLVDFPILIRGELPEGTTVGSTYTTTSIEAAPGEEASIDVEPTFTGTYRAECNVTIIRGESRAIVQRGVMFQIVD